MATADTPGIKSSTLYPNRNVGFLRSELWFGRYELMSGKTRFWSILIEGPIDAATGGLAAPTPPLIATGASPGMYMAKSTSHLASAHLLLEWMSAKSISSDFNSKKSSFFS